MNQRKTKFGKISIAKLSNLPRNAPAATPGPPFQKRRTRLSQSRARRKDRDANQTKTTPDNPRLLFRICAMM